MHDSEKVRRLIHGLDTRFLYMSLTWCISLVSEDFERAAKRKPRSRNEKDRLQAHGAIMAERLRNEFLFAWLLQIENLARGIDGGVVKLSRFNDELTYISGQSIYDLFASGSVRGPYALPWDNAYGFINGVLKPAAALMRSYENDETLKIPPEARALLEMRGLTFEE